VETGARCQLVLFTNRKLHAGSDLSICTKIIDLEMTLNGVMSSPPTHRLSFFHSMPSPGWSMALRMTQSMTIMNRKGDRMVMYR